MFASILAWLYREETKNVEVLVVDRVYLLGMAEFIYGRKNESSEFNIFEHVRCLEWGG